MRFDVILSYLSLLPTFVPSCDVGVTRRGEARRTTVAHRVWLIIDDSETAPKEHIDDRIAVSLAASLADGQFLYQVAEKIFAFRRFTRLAA